MSILPSRELTVVEVLDYLDGPILFTAKDVEESSYVCVFLQNTAEDTQFLCTRISDRRLRKFLAGTVDLRSTIVDAPGRDHLLLKTTNEDAPLVGTPILLGDIDKTLLPAEGYYVEPSEAHSLKSDERVLMETSLEVDEASYEHAISAYPLSAFIKVWQDLVKMGFKRKARKRNIDPGNYTLQISGIGQFASFGLRFQSKEKADLSLHLEMEKSLDLIQLLLERSAQPSLIIEILTANKGHFVRSYRRFVEFLCDNSASLAVKWQVPRQTEKMRRFHLTINQAREIREALSKKQDLDNETVTIVGKLISVDTRNGSWVAVDEEGESYSGHIKTGLEVDLDNLVTSTVYYSFLCEETITEDVFGRETKKLFLLEKPTINSSANAG